jgi:thiamine-phosphate pyrophosphorylase
VPLPSLPPLYPIVDEGAANLAGYTVPALAQAFLEGGARFLQIRSKLAPSGRFVEQAIDVAARAHPWGALVVVNDRFDVALAADLRAVHVGQDDVPVPMVRRFLGPEGIIGLSTHTREQIDAALYEPIDYLAVGPIFATGTKDPGYDPVGLDLVAYAAGKTELPIVAIGGITLERAARVLAAGARSVAVIGDLLRTGDPAGRVREYLAALRPARGA